MHKSSQKKIEQENDEDEFDQEFYLVKARDKHR